MTRLARLWRRWRDRTCREHVCCPILARHQQWHHHIIPADQCRRCQRIEAQ